VPALIQALKGTDEAVRGPAAQSLGAIHDQPETVVSLLIAALDEPSLQAEAAEGLAGFGPQAKAAIPKLLTLFETKLWVDSCKRQRGPHPHLLAASFGQPVPRLGRSRSWNDLSGFHL
jgi:hypothetical protein